MTENCTVGLSVPAHFTPPNHNQPTIFSSVNIHPWRKVSVMGKNKTVVVSNITATPAVVKKEYEQHGPHLSANKRLKAETSLQQKNPMESKKKNSSRARSPNIVLFQLDPTFPSKFDFMLDPTKKQDHKIFYNDDKGIAMSYPKDTEKVCYSRIPLSKLKVVLDHDDDNNFNVIIGHPKDNTDEKTFVVLKVSRTCARIKPPKMKAHHSLLENLLVNMPNVKRGGMRTGVESKYVCFGTRKNPKDCELGEYAFLPNVAEEDKQQMKKGVVNLVEAIESRSMGALHRAHLKGDGSAEIDHLQKIFNLPSISHDGVATQLALAKGYCSPVHTDKDFYYSTLSCYDAKATKNQLLYHFCFPTYGIAIPMRSGDIILFNPLVPHCATNPRVATALIYSLYVSNKTYNTHVANITKNEDENNEDKE
jgi:hypothetical protein